MTKSNFREIIITEDGSHSLFVPEIDEHYHSLHGAIQESQHVYINAGMRHLKKEEKVIFEVGFGTGLNAFLTLLEIAESNEKINYYTIEKYPLSENEYKQLNYPELLNNKEKANFEKLHLSLWDETVEITPRFFIQKINTDLRDIILDGYPFFDLIYFDAFAPNKQPDLWDLSIYNKLYNHMNAGGIFVTYCAKGKVRRELQQCGFKVERIAGPPGKFEMIRAIK
jgi:tRNA U34 5-methylaminomethyl-2-thiouridine-forming methyltransferase MnmC